MVKYRHVFSGDFYRKKNVDGILYDDPNYYNFQIEVPIPVDYDTKEDAAACHCSLRFEKEEGHAVLRIYHGSWYEHVDGDVIDTVRWNEYWKYKTSRSKVFAKDMGGFVDAEFDYIPDATPWDELFDIQSQPEDWKNTVENLAYSIQIFDTEE